MQEYLYNIACTWLACGLDPQKVVFFKQSDVKEVFELCWILSNVTPKGLMNRAHAYKAIVEKNETDGEDVDSGVNMGLYNYPILMAADILLYDTNKVPVGLDQKQHIEIARDIATYFNNKYGETLTLPEEQIDSNLSVLVGLDGRKMSKSYGNTIQLFTDEKTLQKSINRIVTNSLMPGEPKELDCTINKLYKIFASSEQQAEFDKKLAEIIKKDEFFKGISRPVNAKLQKIFGQLGYVEQTGHGIPLIISKYGMQAFDITENFVNVVIPFNREFAEKQPEISKPLNESQAKIYNYLKEHPEATIKILVSECGVSDGYARKILTFLKENGYVRHEGSNKNGSWKILK